MNKININNFDFLRVVFALTVALSHLIGLSEIKLFQSFEVYFNAPLAINGFFVISGFLIAKSYESTKTIKEYLLRRIKRIVPAYITLIFLCAIFFVFISSYTPNEYFLNSQFWKYLAANLTFQNYIAPCLPGVFVNNMMCTVNSSLWTIKIEETFYLSLPIFYWLVKFKNIYVISSIIYLSSIIYFNYFLSIDMYRIAKQLPGAFAFFIVGVIFFKNFSYLIKNKHYFIIPCLLLFYLEQYILESHILKPITYGFMVFYITYSLKWLNNFGKHGDFTYGIYIYHFPIIQVFVYYGFFNEYNPIIITLVFFSIVLILSVISWYFVELPFLSKNRKIRYKKL